jgi:hypothetical protein
MAGGTGNTGTPDPSRYLPGIHGAGERGATRSFRNWLHGIAGSVIRSVMMQKNALPGSWDDTASPFLQGIKTATDSPRVRFAMILVSYSAVAALFAYIMGALSLNESMWASFDAYRFHSMAETIIAGLTPYIDFVDPKPPLLYFTVALMDLIAPAGSIDIPVIAGINVITALLIWRIGEGEYGTVAGYAAGLLYLVAAVFVEGYFLFSEQFAVLFILCAYLLACRSHPLASGTVLGLACGFKQYAILAAIPLLYLMWATGDRRHYQMLGCAAAVLIGIFGALSLAYGTEAMYAALYWTFGIGPSYLQGTIADLPHYAPRTTLAFAANLLASVIMVLPTLLFATASVARRGFRSPEERTMGLLVLVFLSTLLIRQYLHYWILLLPFLALLSCREFGDDRLSPRRPE